MRTLISDPMPREVAELLERRRQLGQDLFDEVWEGVLHMNPAPGLPHAQIESQLHRLIGPVSDAASLTMTGQFNLGEDGEDFRVSDLGLHRAGAGGVWQPTAALVIEIVSPGDETWEKLPFYAAREVDEVLIVDPQEKRVDWLGRSEGEYRGIVRSAVIKLGPAELASEIDWP